MSNRKTPIKANGHSGPLGRANGHALASTERGGIPAADDDRIGWQLMYQLLESNAWLITENCGRLIESIPQLVRDDRRQEDIRKVEGDDSADAASYRLVSDGRFAGVGPAFAPARAGQAPPYNLSSHTPHFVTVMPLAKQIARQVSATDQTSRAIHYQRLEPRRRNSFGLRNCPDGQGSALASEGAFGAQQERRRCYGKRQEDTPVERPLWEQQSFPEKLFRFIALLCLVGCGGSAIYVASHVGSMEDAYFRARDLASYCFTAIWIFLFFYAQYRVVPRFIHRDLDRRVGLWHAGASLALLLFGGLEVVLPQTKSDLPSSLLFWITLLGEATFIGNVIWSYVNGEREVPVLPVVPTAKTTPDHVPDASPKNMGWPKSPVKLFGIGAAFFAGGGIVSLILNTPSFPIPVPISGQMHFLPYGVLWLVAAVPFGVFALLYKFLMDTQQIVFEESLNRIHFVVTMIAVFDMVRVFMAWEQKLVSKMLELYFGPEFEWLTGLFVLSVIVFIINIFKSGSQATSRT